MKKMMVVCALAVVGFVLFTLAAPRRAFGTTRYIAQTAGTFSGGTACNGQTAMTPATLNTITNSAGDLDYICGTLTFSASSSNAAIIINGSGTSGNPITIKFDSGASLKAPYFPPAGTSAAISINGSYVTINGNGGAGGWTQGIIESTLNGDPGATCPGGACAYQVNSNAIQFSGTNITVTGLTIEDMYVTTGNPNSNGAGECLYANATITNLTVTNNLMHDMSWCLDLQYGSGSSGITISGNQIYNIDHGIALGGPASNSSLSNVSIFNNNIHDYSNWDTTSDSWHHDGIHVWGYNDNGSDTISGVSIYNNTFGGCIGQNVTAHIFMETNNGGTKATSIYNNVLIDTCSGNDANGLITLGTNDGPYTIYNNTAMGASGDFCYNLGTTVTPTFINNVASGCGTLIEYAGTFASGGLNNNIYANSGSNAFVFDNNYYTTGQFSTWKSVTGQDGNSSYVSSALLNASGVPQSGSPTIRAGADLSSLGITHLDSDIAGNPRPSTGPWTIGAYATTGPLPPTSLTGTVQTQ